MCFFRWVGGLSLVCVLMCLFFFFKQKTAYEMLRSLVGSEMCIRDSYSSVAHMGFATLGIFSLTLFGFQGALLQMLNHGVTTGALFLCVGIVYERTHSREIYDNAGLGKIMPIYVGFFGLFSISSFAFPGTNNFVGELYILIGTFANHKAAGFFAVIGAILAAAYMLKLLKQIIWGREDKRSIKDMNVKEIAYLIPLAVFVLWMGLFPAPFVHTFERTITHLTSRLQVYFP